MPCGPGPSDEWVAEQSVPNQTLWEWPGPSLGRECECAPCACGGELDLGSDGSVLFDDPVGPSRSVTPWLRKAALT
jgi:hypothetical protein